MSIDHFLKKLNCSVTLRTSKRPCNVYLPQRSSKLFSIFFSMLIFSKILFIFILNINKFTILTFPFNKFEDIRHARPGKTICTLKNLIFYTLLKFKAHSLLIRNICTRNVEPGIRMERVRYSQSDFRGESCNGKCKRGWKGHTPSAFKRAAVPFAGYEELSLFLLFALISVSLIANYSLACSFPVNIKLKQSLQLLEVFPYVCT